MSRARLPFEPWAYVAFLPALATAVLLLVLGLRPGGALPVLAYRYGLLLVGWSAAVGLTLALLWCVRRRPLLQRGRPWPLALLGASLWACSLPFAYPSSHEGKYSPRHFRLPFDGNARVRQGGPSARANFLRFDPARCFGTVFEGDGGAELCVRSPSEGELVALAGEGEALHVVLRTGEREFCVLAGLSAADGARTPGTVVRTGEVLGRARGPLTVHLQDHSVPGEGEGIPMRFFAYRADGRLAEAGVPVPPQVVGSNAAPVAGAVDSAK